MPSSWEWIRNDMKHTNAPMEEWYVVVPDTTEVGFVTSSWDEETSEVIFCYELVSVVFQSARVKQSTFSRDHSIE